jgi:hypothetical protein
MACANCPSRYSVAAGSYLRKAETVYIRSIPSTRGTFRERHDSSVRDVVDAKARKTKRAGADGQVAWSWSPDAGIKSVEMRVSRKAGAGSMGDGG